MPTDAFPSSRPLDLLIVGAGPAGLLLANAAVREGLRVGVVDGAPMRAFEATFGLYEDELAPEWGDAVAGRWSSARVLPMLVSMTGNGRT